MQYRFLHILGTVCLFLSLTTVSGQGTEVTFGKNRVQFHRDFDEWVQYESDNFITYWYGEARNIGQATVQLAEYDFAEIQALLEHRINQKMEILVYTDLTDIKQSNIGNEDVFTNTGGKTKIVGNKVFVYYNGDHNALRKQVREGIATVYMESMLFGSNLQEIVQNAVMLNLPEWFKEGLIAYAGEPWNTRQDDELRDQLFYKKYKDFKRFSQEHPRLAGQSMWYYISEVYGKATVSNLLYLTRINRSIESGFLYVLGRPYEMIVNEWTLYFKERYGAENQVREYPAAGQVEFKNKHMLPLTNIRISPDGQRIAYVLNEIGRYRVIVQELNNPKKKKEVLLRKGNKNPFQATDYAYPLLAFDPTGQELAIMYEHRDRVRLLRTNMQTGKSTTELLGVQYQRVYSIDYMTPNNLLLSASSRGISDLYVYFLNTRQGQRITNDIWDDLDATYVRIGDRRGILFSSNRPDSLMENVRMDTILPIGDFNLFFYDMDKGERELVQITKTPLANERNPIALSDEYFGYLSDRSGVFNREAGRLEDYIHHYEQVVTLVDGEAIRLHIDSTLQDIDSTLIDTITIEPIYKTRAVIHNQTNYRQNIRHQHSSVRSSKVVEVFQNGLEPQIFVSRMDPEFSKPAPATEFMQRLRQSFSGTGPFQKANLNPGGFYQQGRLQPQPNRPQTDETKDIPEEAPIFQVPEDSKSKPDSTIDIDNYLFQSEFDTNESAPQTTVAPAPEKKDPNAPASERTEIQVLPQSDVPAEQETVSDRKVYRFRPGRIIPYRLKFRTDFVNVSLDNSVLFEGLNTFSAGQDNFGVPPAGILIKGNFKDLLEDHEFEIGARIPTTFDGSEYFFIYKNKKHRFDHQINFYRRSQRLNQPSGNGIPQRAKQRILLGQYEVRYPLDIFRSFRGRLTLRDDRITQQASDSINLQVPTDNQQRVGLRLEYVFDNTLQRSINILNGTRYKVYAEVYKRFDLEILDGFSFDFGEGFMTIIGLDFRHYERLLKHSVIALRLSGATTFGSERILYYLGGVNNWLFADFDQSLATPPGNFAFEALAAPVRGFPYRARNGGSYALFNAEVRVPVFQYISQRIRSAFIRNFQIIGFFDAGTAWEGASPFSDDNPLNITNVGDGPVRLRVKFFRDPIIAGYGFGVRTTLFGYFFRMDYAWGVETREVLSPRFHFSLGTDF